VDRWREPSVVAKFRSAVLTEKIIGDTLSESDIIIRIVNGGVNTPAYGNSIRPNGLKQLTAFLQSRKRPMPAGLETSHP
jgi:hypothetical protein